MEEELKKKEDAMNDDNDPDSENDPELNELTKQAEEKQAVSYRVLSPILSPKNEPIFTLDEQIKYFGSGSCSSSNKCLGTKS